MSGEEKNKIKTLTNIILQISYDFNCFSFSDNFFFTASACKNFNYTFNYIFPDDTDVVVTVTAGLFMIKSQSVK